MPDTEARRSHGSEAASHRDRETLQTCHDKGVDPHVTYCAVFRLTFHRILHRSSRPRRLMTRGGRKLPGSATEKAVAKAR
jgi:hypothetical protein